MKPLAHNRRSARAAARNLLERRVIAAIIERPEEYLVLRPRYCPCCVFADPRHGFLANRAADAAAVGRRAGVAELARDLFRGGPINEAGAARYLSEIVLLEPVTDLRRALARLRGAPTRRAIEPGAA